MACGGAFLVYAPSQLPYDAGRISSMENRNTRHLRDVRRGRGKDDGVFVRARVREVSAARSHSDRIIPCVRVILPLRRAFGGRCSRGARV